MNFTRALPGMTEGYSISLAQNMYVEYISFGVVDGSRVSRRCSGPCSFIKQYLNLHRIVSSVALCLFLFSIYFLFCFYLSFFQRYCVSRFLDGNIFDAASNICMSIISMKSMMFLLRDGLTKSPPNHIIVNNGSHYYC